MKNKYVSSLLTFLFFGAVCCIPAVTYAAEEVMKSAGCKTEYFLIKDLSNSYKKKSGRKIQIGKTGNKKAVNLYKLTATYYLILSGSDNALVNDFVEYSRSPEGREVIGKNFIPYSE